MPVLREEVPAAGLPEETPGRARDDIASVSARCILRPSARAQFRTEPGVPLSPVRRALPVGRNQGQAPAVARDEGRADGGDSGRRRTQRGRFPRAQRGERWRGVRPPAAAGAATDLHVQTLPLHFLQLPGTHETHQQISPHREPAGDAAADDRAAVSRAQNCSLEKVEKSLFIKKSFQKQVLLFGSHLGNTSGHLF